MGIRTVVDLPETTHRRLKHLAVGRDTSVAHLIREAVDGMVREDSSDVKRARRILRSFRPGTGVPYATYRAGRLK